MRNVLEKCALATLFFIFLIRFPPLYYLGVNNTIFTTHFFAVALLIVTLSILLLHAYKINKEIALFNLEYVLISLFFISQSLSIIGAFNITIFFQRYWKIVVGMLLFFMVRGFVANKELRKKFVNYLLIVLLVGSVFTTLLQFTLFFYPDLYFNFGGVFIYSNIFNITKANFAVGKLFDDTFLETVIPILFYFYFTADKKLNLKVRLTMLLLILADGYIAFASNFRYRFVSFIFASLICFFIFQKMRKNLIILLPVLILIIILFKASDIVLTQTSGYTVIDRLTNQSEDEDLSTILWRFKMFDYSIKMAQAKPFGVGLGNFYDSVPNKINTNLLSSEERKIQIAALESGPHNIFFQYLGETSFIGLLSFIGMMIYFLVKDYRIIKSTGSVEKKALIASFWTLIAMVQFFPPLNLTFYSLFFVLRATIQ